jgi:hypothetical protein
MATDKGITITVIAFAVVAMFTLNFAMTHSNAPDAPLAVSPEITSSIPR